jgi:hypothetical protein
MERIVLHKINVQLIQIKLHVMVVEQMEFVPSLLFQLKLTLTLELVLYLILVMLPKMIKMYVIQIQVAYTIVQLQEIQQLHLVILKLVQN